MMNGVSVFFFIKKFSRQSFFNLKFQLCILAPPNATAMPLVPIIVGAVIGGALVIGAIGAGIYYCIKKRGMNAANDINRI